MGFHPDLTGEENVYLNGAMLGFDQADMRERFDEIVSFSEIGDFVYSPIRTYSSGMLMRLGFSIAMCVNPDILLIDEVLAVGDEAFQEKCFERLGGFKTSGKTIVLVSHGMEMVEKFCDRAILLHEGRVVCDDVPEKTIEAYHAILYGEDTARGGDDLEPEKSEAKNLSPRSVSRRGFFGCGEGGAIPLWRGGSGEAGSASPEKLSPETSSERRTSLQKAAMDPERIRIIEVDDPSFFAEDLFNRAFGHSPPPGPSSYVALYSDSESPSTVQVIGFVHLEQVGEMGLVGGVCVDHPWRGRGIGKRLLSFVSGKRRKERAFFVHTDDPRLASVCGYEALPYPYLMVKWMEPLSEEEKTRILGAALEFGPF